MCARISIALAHPKRRTEAIGRSRGGLTTRIHAVVDALGDPLAIRLTGGQAHDITQAEALLAEVEPQALIADKGYDADGFIETLTVRRIEPVIPSKANNRALAVRLALYAERNLVERFSTPSNDCRGIATRYEKPARFFTAEIHLACALAWLE